MSIEGENIHLDSARSIAQSRIALRRKPQCTHSYIRIMKTVVNAKQSKGDTYATSRAVVTRRVIELSLPNPDSDAPSESAHFLSTTDDTRPTTKCANYAQKRIAN